MQIGRIVFVLTEEESNQLLSILKNSDNEILKKSLQNAKKTVFVDDYRPDKIDTLPR